MAFLEPINQTGDRLGLVALHGELGCEFELIHPRLSEVTGAQLDGETVVGLRPVEEQLALSELAGDPELEVLIVEGAKAVFRLLEIEPPCRRQAIADARG